MKNCPSAGCHINCTAPPRGSPVILIAVRAGTRRGPSAGSTSHGPDTFLHA